MAEVDIAPHFGAELKVRVLHPAAFPLRADCYDSRMASNL